jgi:hypothetical protein
VALCEVPVERVAHSGVPQETLVVLWQGNEHGPQRGLEGLQPVRRGVAGLTEGALDLLEQGLPDLGNTRLHERCAGMIPGRRRAPQEVGAAKAHQARQREHRVHCAQGTGHRVESLGVQG